MFNFENLKVSLFPLFYCKSYKNKTSNLIKNNIENVKKIVYMDELL